MSERRLSTILGEVTTQRLAYQARGHEDLHPLAAAHNLPKELYSHGVRRLVAKHAAKPPFDEVCETVEDFTGTRIGKRQVEELAVRAAEDFDAFYEARAANETSHAGLRVISTDGKGIVMRHEGVREVTKRAAETSTRKVATRLTPGEKPNRKRMAQVVIVYGVAPFPRTIGDITHTLRKRDEVDAKPATSDGQARLCERGKVAARGHRRGLRRGAATRPRTRAAMGRHVSAFSLTSCSPQKSRTPRRLSRERLVGATLGCVVA